MLEQLQGIHAELLSAISDLEMLIARASPDRSTLAEVRLKLSRASMRRMRFLEYAVYPQLLDGASAANTQTLKKLRDDAAALRAVSTSHVGRWTLQQAVDDWNGYRRASAAMTTSMRARIATEIEVLGPLFAQASTAARYS